MSDPADAKDLVLCEYEQENSPKHFQRQCLPGRASRVHVWGNKKRKSFGQGVDVRYDPKTLPNLQRAGGKWNYPHLPGIM